MAGVLSRFSGLAVGALVVGALFLGGCTQQKEKQSALMEENKKLRDGTEQMQTQLQQTQAAQAQLQAEKDQLAAQLAAEQQRKAQMSQPSERTGGSGRQPTRSGSSGNTVITVAGDVLFSPGKAELTAGGKKELDQVAARLKREFGGNMLRIEGYTDSDPITKSRWSSNEELSSARAVAVEKYLATKGISKNRMEAVGMGAAKPKATKKDSRRVEIVVVGG